MVLGMLVFDETMQANLLGQSTWTPLLKEWFEEARVYLDKPAIAPVTIATGALVDFYDRFSLILQGKATSEELMEQSSLDNELMQAIGFLDRAEEQPEDSLSQAAMMGLQETTSDFRKRLDTGEVTMATTVTTATISMDQPKCPVV